jgi:signal transduction histidine kinase
VRLRTGGRSGLQVEAGDGILAWAHEDLLERVISHLVQNAFDASGSQPDVEVQVRRDSDGVMIDVSDRGKGMTAEFIRERLFRPFETTKDSGMGIGAFECQQYVQRVGGRQVKRQAAGRACCLRRQAADPSAGARMTANPRCWLSR